MGFNGAFSGGGGGSGGAPGPQGPTGPEGPQGDPGDPGATTVTGLTDRYEELAWQTFTEPAHGGLLAASPTRDIQTAIDATPVGPACQVVVGPGSYSGATVTIPAGRNNIAIIGPTAGDFGGTVVSLSSGRALTIGNNAVRVRLVNLQIEGLTTISTTGAGIHRIERCQLEGGLTVGAISSYIYIVGCTLGSVTVDAGFTGLLLIDRCQFNAGAVFTNNTLQTRVLISDTAGLATAPSTTAFLNGRFQLASGATQFFQDGALLLKAPLTAVNGLTPAADRIAYYTSASAAAMTALSAFGRSLIDDADASAARTTLGLGTAATANTGTGSGNIPVLDGSARLPAVDGSQLTGITSTQVSGVVPVDVQTFTADGSWSKPDGVTVVQVVLIGGGGGGGSGYKGDQSAANLYSGAGGGGGGVTLMTLRASEITSPVTVTVGQGGAGGASRTANGGAGNPGSAGTASTFGTYARATGGGAGAGGVISATGGAGGLGNFATGGVGHDATSTATAGASDAVDQFTAPGGGAAGGGIGQNASGLERAGGAGADTGLDRDATGLAGGTAGPTSGTPDGGAGAGQTAGNAYAGAGGGGGAGKITGTTAGAGGNGGIYGGGGGGGGAGKNSVTHSGPGGSGANGIVRVVSW